MIVEILSTGDEIRTGAVIDSNSAYIAQKLEESGIKVNRHSCVGDDVAILTSVMQEIGNRADFALVTGGLGPTADDLTAEAAANAVGVDLVLDHKALQSIEDFFKNRKYIMNESNRKQAMLPYGAESIYNPIGSAPGFFIKIKKCYFFFMPGVPFEMKKMLSDTIITKIDELSGREKQLCMVKTISTFGITEAATGEKLAGLTSKFPEIKVGFRSKFPEIHVKLYLYGENEKVLNARMKEVCDWTLEKIGNKAFSVDGSPLEEIIGILLRQKRATLAIAESCTGGLLSHRLTNIPGSSDYFLFSGITYSNESKIKVLGVSPATIQKYGAVHQETAKEMAEGARRIAGATYGLSTSGIAGPGGGTDEKPVGTICIGIASPSGTKGIRLKSVFDKRSMNKKVFAMQAMDFLRRELLIGMK